MPRLVIHAPGQPPLLFELVKPRVTVGRSERNDLVLDDVNASRFHAVLELTPQGYRITDQHSRNGMYVGGQRSNDAVLENGSTVRLGDTLLQFEDSGPAWDTTTTTVLARSDITADLLAGPDEERLREATQAFHRLSERSPLPANPLELQKKLRESERRALLFEVLSRTRRALQHASEPPLVLAAITRLVFVATDAERALVMLWDEEKGCLRPADIHAAPGFEVRDTQVALSQTLLSEVLQSRRAVLVRDAAADPRFVVRDSVARSGLRSAICAPMTVQDRLYGLVYADNRQRPRVFHQDDVEVLAILALEAALALDSARAREELLQQERVRTAYRRFLPEHLAEMLARTPDAVELGGERKNVTALFADLRGFTSLTETLLPEAAVELLNSFFTEMAAVIFQHGGTVDKFLGDGLLAVFGAPLSQPDDALRAVQCALAMQAALEELAGHWRREERPLIPMGIGINSGVAIAGNLGSPRRMEYTVVGDTVNVAARLTQHAGPGEILLGESTWREVGSEIAAEPLAPLALKGKREPVRAYRVSGRAAGVAAGGPPRD